MKNIIKYVSILCITLSVSSCISTKSTIKNIDDNAPNLTLTKNNTFLITDYSQDPKYGYDADYPVNVFYKNSKGEDINAHRFLNALAGPKGEKITFTKLESCCPFPTKRTEMGAGFLDRLASQLIGWNAWAWKTRTDWQTQQHSWALMLRETFPQTQVVVDAPLQMAQQVERLRQTSGQLGAGDLEPMLAALGQAMPPGLTAPRQWTYQPGQLRLQNFNPDATAQETLQQSLTASGYQWRAEGDAWLIRLPPAAEVKP